MPKRLNRPNFKMPGYPWDDYIKALEDKIGRLESERDGLQSKLQQPSLTGGSLFDAPTVAVDPPTPRTALDDDPDKDAMPRFTGASEESRKAALALYPKTGNQRHKILLYAFKQGSHGITFSEAREALGIYGADRRISDLVDGGWLERTERSRETAQGQQANVVITTQKAAEWIRHRDTQAFQEATAR